MVSAKMVPENSGTKKVSVEHRGVCVERRNVINL